MGYDNLDIAENHDGSWDIIEYIQKPYVPCVTEWQMVLGTMEGVLKTYGFCERFVKQVDMNRKEFWAREEAKTQAVADEHEAKEERAVEMAEIASQAVIRNPGLMNRIAKNGMKEMELGKIAKHIPKHEFIKPRKGQTIKTI
jgi:hypothetical protein